MVQDSASRHPVPIIVKSTNAKSVIPVLRDTCNLFEKPLRQKKNLQKMGTLNKSKVKIPPGHPTGNNVETVMKPLGKAMKIGNIQNLSEQETFSAF